MRRDSRPFSIAVLSALLGSAGCCDLAGLLCGPDRTHWVPISYDSPRAALDTFLEAIRRDATSVIADSLSPRFKQRYGIGSFEAAILWEKIKDQTRGVHLLGTAKVTEPATESDTHVSRISYLLEKRGYRFRVDLARYAYWGVHYELDGVLLFNEAYARNSADTYVDDLSGYVSIERGDLDAAVQVLLREVELPDGVGESDLRKVVAGTEWRVEDLVLLEEPEHIDP